MHFDRNGHKNPYMDTCWTNAGPKQWPSQYKKRPLYWSRNMHFVNFLTFISAFSPMKSYKGDVKSTKSMMMLCTNNCPVHSYYGLRDDYHLG